jgi:hypothetical protein
MRKITKRCVTAVIGLAIAFAVVPIAMTCAAATSSAATSTDVTSPDDSKTVPVIDGGIGPCTADFTISDAGGKPLYDAKIKVHIAYRFMNAHKLDLEVGTNADGNARFTGLPDKIKHGIYFYATQGELAGEVFADPASNCKAQFAITLRKKAE